MPGHLRSLQSRDGDRLRREQQIPAAHLHRALGEQQPCGLQGRGVLAARTKARSGGGRHERMAERRAAQLAAAAELAADQPLLLSSGPDRPGVDRWVQRQLGREESDCSACASSFGGTSPGPVEMFLSHVETYRARCRVGLCDPGEPPLGGVREPFEDEVAQTARRLAPRWICSSRSIGPLCAVVLDTREVDFGARSRLNHGDAKVVTVTNGTKQDS